MGVEVEVLATPRTDGGPDWYSFLITNSEGGSIQLGFEPDPEALEEKWGLERDVFVEEWSKPRTPEEDAREERRRAFLLRNAEKRKKISETAQEDACEG